jgi:hypothetical protein
MSLDERHIERSIELIRQEPLAHPELAPRSSYRPDRLYNAEGPCAL